MTSLSVNGSNYKVLIYVIRENRALSPLTLKLDLLIYLYIYIIMKMHCAFFSKHMFQVT